MGSCPFHHDDSKQSRRTFLQRGLAAMAAFTAMALGSTPLAPVLARSMDDTPWKDQPFAGDHWEQCHELRDGKAFPQGGKTEDVDVLIIGGGISGLIAAWQLEPHHHVLVLEKEKTAGGCSRFGTWGDTRYPMGALYYAKPSKEINAFLLHMGMPPVAIPGSADTLFTRGTYTPHLFGDGVREQPYSATGQQGFRTAWRHFAAFNGSDDAPEIPLTSHVTKKARALDEVTFLRYCKDHKIEPQVTKLLDQYVRSCWGVGSEKVSAFAAINFLASEFEPLYAFPGGNGAMTYQLARLLGNHIRTGCFVDRITPGKSTTLVDYVANGVPARIRARQIILATPKHITRKMFQNLPEPWFTAMAKARYGAYLVGAMFLNEPLADRAFDLWVEDRWYSDLCMADWMSSHGHPAANRKTVMVASIPMGEMEGRAALLTTPHEVFEKHLLDEVEKDFAGARGKVAGVQFARWGHPMVIPYPGWITKITPTFYKPFGNIWFANSDAHGLACFESAFSAAMMAAEGVDKALRSPKAASTRGK